ncbi:hypothetical protein I4F81_011092 [Pyropia yezoensis]|uniref:Uncharacterized protein n=1 Tax=Pyropia yezoensis TaxID=2788 RepID=A0ACC3CEJ6_PYRYE|nr:hypothetical protein I4F81_011092 [Neopyropia yezoensis]
MHSPQLFTIQPLDSTDGWQGWSNYIYLPIVVFSEIGTAAHDWSLRGACAVGLNAPVEVSELSFFSAGLLLAFPGSCCSGDAFCVNER